MNVPAIPPRLANRPTTPAGLVIPYATMILASGQPDFTTNDEVRRMECIRDRKCPICGDPLDYWIYFIGSPISHKSRVFIDPAMHEECARYSTQACPFLRNEHAAYKEHTRSMDDPTLRVIVSPMPARPPKMGLFLTRTYQVMTQRGQLVARAAAWKAVEWF